MINVYARDELDEFVPLDLSVRFDDAVLDEPGFEVAVAPGAPDRIIDIVIIQRHFGFEGVAFLFVVGFDEAVADEPFVLRVPPRRRQYVNRRGKWYESSRCRKYSTPSRSDR